MGPDYGPFNGLQGSRIGAHSVDDRNPACLYVDLIFQKHRSSGSIVHICIHIR